MANKGPELKLFARKTLDQVLHVPDEIISVYVVEQHIWNHHGTEAEQKYARGNRVAETRTVEEFLIDPVRPFLMDFFRQVSAPYLTERKDNPIGQGYWIQAEFGSGKSHLLSFIGSLALGGEKEWNIVRQKEEKAGRGRRESLYLFYEEGLAKKTRDSKGILVAIKTLVGQGGGGIGLSGSGKALTEYVLDAVAEQFYAENGRSLPLYPTQILAERFLRQDLDRYSRDLAKFLKDPTYFNEEEQESLEDFLDDLQNNQDPAVQLDCGNRLWNFYDRYLESRPKIPMETEEVLKHMVQRLLAEGYAGLLLILDEVSLFMKGRSEAQRVEDEKALVVLSNRLAKVENLPVWTVCAAQQAIETKLVGVKNIIADERLKLVPLLNRQDYYYDIALSRVREISEPAAIDQYYEDYKRSFSWPTNEGKDKFAKFFPFYPPAIDVVRAVSYNLTTIRSALYFMLETLKTQRKRHSNELITLWSLFEDVVNYTEDPSGTSRSIASVKTKFPEEWLAYEEAIRQINAAPSGALKAYRSRCEKIVKTLFLYNVANLSPDGLTHDELMNAVMEWKDHDRGQASDLQDNRDHYELLAEKLDIELVQVEKVMGGKYRFNVTGGGPNPMDIFLKARSEAESNEETQRNAWRSLLALDGWPYETPVMTLDLVAGRRSIFHLIAPESQQDITIRWHGREITGRVYMKDLLDTAHRNKLLPSVNSAETGLDFAVYVSSTQAISDLTKLAHDKGDPRILFWSPDTLTPAEQSLLLDFAAYQTMITETKGKETEKAKVIVDWVQGRLASQMGAIYHIVQDSYDRGQITALDHSQMAFQVQGELTAILTPLVGQVLESTYACRDIEFTTPAPFNDVNAINVINGIVRMGEFPRGVKPGKEVSASQNYGFALGIMRKPNDHKLDLRDCRYTRELMDWLEDKLGSGDQNTGIGMPAVTVYKNFTGTGGPNGVNYGLSKRMVQLYLLCLVREGRIRISLSGRNLPVDLIDYSNIAGIEFKTAILDAFDQIQRLKPPEGWEILAPFAAALLNDESLKAVREEADIQAAVQRVLEFKKGSLEAYMKLHAGLHDLLGELRLAFGQPSPALDALLARLVAWEQFLNSPIDPVEPITFLRNGLEKAFGYPVYHQEEVRAEDVDDLTSRRSEIEQAARFYANREEIRAALRYIEVEISDDPALSSLKRGLETCRMRLKDLAGWVASESRLHSEFLTPMKDLIDSYSVRYLQVFDQVVSHTEQVRQQLLSVDRDPYFLALTGLGKVRALGADSSTALQNRFRQAVNSPDLFPASLTRASVERDLPHRPLPAGSPLTLVDGATWIARADEIQESCFRALHTAIQDKVRLLGSPALCERLEQGKNEDLIQRVLQQPSVEVAAEAIAYMFASGDGERLIELLNRYLKKITVKKISMQDFHPGKHTFEAHEVDDVLQEFRRFLQAQFDGKDDDELIVVEVD